MEKPRASTLIRPIARKMGGWIMRETGCEILSEKLSDLLGSAGSVQRSIRQISTRQNRDRLEQLKDAGFRTLADEFARTISDLNQRLCRLDELLESVQGPDEL